MAGIGRLTDRSFWNDNGSYLFRSCWPGDDDLLALFSEIESEVGPDSAAAPQRFLDAASGPGDFTLAAAHLSPQCSCFGVDYSHAPIAVSHAKIEHPAMIAQARIWGRLFGLWRLGRLRETDLLWAAMGRADSNRSDSNRFPELLSGYVEFLRRYSLASAHSYLTPRLKEMGLIDPTGTDFHARLLEKAGEVDGSEPMTRLIREDGEPKARPPHFGQSDVGALCFPDRSFTRILAFEVEPLLRRGGQRWIDEIVRVCRSGGAILYAGARIPANHGGGSEEVAAVRTYFQKHPRVRLVRWGTRTLASWWDPLFNFAEINERVATPYVVAAMRHETCPSAIM